MQSTDGEHVSSGSIVTLELITYTTAAQHAASDNSSALLFAA
jgi:hypothetical protein